MEEKKIMKPCPFCGSKRTIRSGHVAGSGTNYVQVRCRDCYAAVQALGTDKDKAVEAWNRRVDKQ